MGDERKLIIEMLKDGKISHEEARELLAVLGEDESEYIDEDGKPTQKAEEENTHNENESESWSFFEGLKSLLTGVTGPTYEFIEEYSHKFSSLNIRATIRNKNGALTIKGWDRDDCSIKVTKKIKGITPESKARDFAKSYSLLKLGGDFIETEDYKNKHLSISYEIFLPKNLVIDLKNKSVNGKVHLKDIIITQGSVSTVNGKIIIEGVKGKEIEVNGVNGVIDIQADIADISCSTVNGRICVKDLNEKEGHVNLSTVNGSVRIELPKGVRGIGVKGSSVNGRVKIEHSDFGMISQSGKYGSKRAEATTGGAVHRTYSLSTVNGSMTVSELERNL